MKVSMKETGKSIGKRLVGVILLFFIVYGCMGMHAVKNVSAKTVSKVTKVITITNKRNGTVWHTLSIKKGEKVRAKVKFLAVQGKPVDKYFQGDNVWLYGFGNTIDPNSEMEDCFFHSQNKSPKSKLTKDSFKKGNVLTSSYGLNRRMLKWVYWQPLKGIEKIKCKVTYYTESGRPGIKSVKTKRGDVYDPGWK